MKLRVLVPNFHIYISVSDLYIPTMGRPIFCSKIEGPIVGIYKSLTETWMWKFGTRPRSFISWNICFEFSVQSLQCINRSPSRQPFFSSVLLIRIWNLKSIGATDQGKTWILIRIHKKSVSGRTNDTVTCMCSDSQLTRSVLQTHTKRQATQHGWLPSLLGDGWRRQRNWNSVGWGKNIFCTGPTRAAKAEQKSLVPARQAQRTNQGRTPFICTLWVSVHLSFNSQQGQATPL